ncbi:Lsr2 protein [Streptosporangium subroseum]|uniref:Lsr2 protein n=1 Tax=Streptosporangium subroseum TaxID=106412 RepID=A0A239B1J0_9ACTN|nr:histone-like nucleoid-structuring protein Lsr2 [Streptosporangium subroseum]SNS01680.1 Lsr2 protein [Streptosporangium subroseum]
MFDADFTPLRVTYRTHGRDTSRRIRTWAKAKGYSVSDRGRVAPEIIEAFFTAHPEIYEQANTFEMVHATARTPGASPEDYAWQGKDDSPLGDIYTIVFVRGLDEHEVLRQLGAADEDIRPIEDGDYSYPEEPQIITVRRIGDWTVAIEHCGSRGAQWEILSALSRNGEEAMAVQRHDYAQHHVAYAVDGHLITDINPGFPIDRQGADPDRLNRHLRELGIDPAADDSIDNPIPAALALATRITGVMITPQHLHRPILGAAIPGAYL